MHNVQTDCWQQRRIIVDVETIDLTWRTLSTYQILSLYIIFTTTSFETDVQSNDLKTSKKSWKGAYTGNAWCLRNAGKKGCCWDEYNLKSCFISNRVLNFFEASSVQNRVPLLPKNRRRIPISKPQIHIDELDCYKMCSQDIRKSCNETDPEMHNVHRCGDEGLLRRLL